MGMRDSCLLTYVILGPLAPRSRVKADARGFYAYGNGSWLPFSGVMSEGSLLKAKRYRNALEGLFRLQGNAETCAGSEQPFARTVIRELPRIQEKTDSKQMLLKDMFTGEALDNAGERGRDGCLVRRGRLCVSERNPEGCQRLDQQRRCPVLL